MTGRGKAAASGARPLGRRMLRSALFGAKIALAVVAGLLAVLTLAAMAFSVVNPPATFYMQTERARLGSLSHEWVPISAVPAHLPRSLVAAEDANFCLHWGFDMAAIRLAIAEGRGRGASTISQQVAKNVYLWQGRSWARKGLEAFATVLTETFWSKRRILEVYMNVAEFDEGVFGVGAASRHYFGVPPERLTAAQSARLAAVLPSPKTRSASRPTPFVERRARAIGDGAATIARDGRDACFRG